MLMRFDPFRDVDRLMDQLSGQTAQPTRSFPMDAFRRGDRFLVHLDLPGIDPGAIDLTVDRNVLTVRAERHPSREPGDELLVSERPQGTFTRQLLLGDTLDPDRLQATYEHGVLTITIPVAEQAKPRRIEVSSPAGDEPQTIEGTGQGPSG
jgi:HSP20 family protein